jgi:hypothetical protein
VNRFRITTVSRLAGDAPFPRRASARGVAAAFVAACMLSLALGAGCTTKAKAQAEARTAFLAGQQQAMMRMQQNQAPTVSVNGKVRMNVVPWNEELTLARAIVAANYYGSSDPREIILVRRGAANRIDPKTLVDNEGPVLLPGDVIELR